MSLFRNIRTCCRYQTSYLSTTNGVKKATEFCTIEELGKVLVGQIVSVKAYIHDIGPVKKTNYQDNPGLDKQEGTQVDPTASIKITLFGESVKKLEKGLTYEIVNLRVRKNPSGELYVSSPQSYTMMATEIEPFQNSVATVSVSHNLNINELVVEIKGINNVYRNIICLKCRGPAALLNNGRYAKFNGSCKMKQKGNACSVSWSAKLFVQDERNPKNRLHLTAYHNIIKMLIAINSEVDLDTCTQDDLEFAILDINHIKTAYDTINRKITSVEEMPQLDI